jgi:hypothetical protein
MGSPYMTANVYLGVNYTAIGYTGSQGFIYKETITGRITAKINENVEIRISGGAPSTPVTWSVSAGIFGQESGNFVLDNRGRYVLTVTQSQSRSYIYTFRFAATGNILTHKIDFTTTPWLVELSNRYETECGPWANLTLTVPSVLYGFGSAVSGNPFDGYHNSSAVDQAALHAKLALPGQTITVKRTLVMNNVYASEFGGFGPPGTPTAGFSQNFSSLPAQCGWTIETTTEAGRPYPLSVGPAPLTAYEGEVLEFKITVPPEAPKNTTAYLIVGQPSTVDMNDITRTGNTTEVNIYNGVGYGRFVINLDQLTEGAEYFQVWVEYPQGTIAGSYGKVDIIDNSTSTKIAIQPINLPYATVGTLYNINLVVSGGEAPYTYDVTIGTLPTGIALRSDGSLYGTPTAAGTAYFTVTVTDVNNIVGTQNYVLTVDLTAIELSLPEVTATKKSAYTNTVFATGGVAPYTFSQTGGNLPLGLTISSAGIISGTPSTAGSYTFSIKAVGQNGSSATEEFTIVVTELVISLIPASLPAAKIGVSWSQWIRTTGAVGTLTYEILNTLTVTSQLPPGITRSGNNSTQYTSSDGPDFSGIPTLVGSYEFLIRVTDSNGTQDTRTYVIEVQPDEVVSFSPNAIFTGQTYDVIISGAAPGSRVMYKLVGDSSIFTTGWITLNNLYGPGTHQDLFPVSLLQAGQYTFEFEFEASNNVRQATIDVGVFISSF